MIRCSFLFLVTLMAGLSYGQEFRLGAVVDDFSVNDPAGNTAVFSNLRGETTVVMFISTKCPISNDYNERIKAVYADYTARGVKFVFLNANANEPPAEVLEHARASAFPFPVYKDSGNVVADRFGAQFTPESFVIDASGVVRYHGYIDDSRNPERIQFQGLRTALDQVLAGDAVERAETKAFGCTIKRSKKIS